MRILLADDQPQVRSALKLILEQEAGLTVVGEAGEVDDLMAQAQVTLPDVILMDWELPDRRPRSGALHPRRALVGALRSLCPEALLIALSGRPEARRTAMDAGADAFISKGDPPESLLQFLQGAEATGSR